MCMDVKIYDHYRSHHFMAHQVLRLEDYEGSNAVTLKAVIRLKTSVVCSLCEVLLPARNKVSRLTVVYGQPGIGL